MEHRIRTYLCHLHYDLARKGPHGTSRDLISLIRTLSGRIKQINGVVVVGVTEGEAFLSLNS